MDISDTEKIKTLERQLLHETAGRLQAERQALQSSIAFMQLRLPMVEQELAAVQAQLAAVNDGPAQH